MYAEAGIARSGAVKKVPRIVQRRKLKKQSSLFRYSWIATHPADARNDTIYKDIKHTVLSCHPLRTCGTVKTVHYGVTQYKKRFFNSAFFCRRRVGSYSADII